MKTVLKGIVFENGLLTKEYNQDFAIDHLQEEVVYINRNGIKGKVTHIQLNEIILEIRDAVVKQRYQVDVKHDFPLIKMHFEIEGSNQYTPRDPNQGIPINVPHGRYNFFYLPEVDGTLTFDTHRRKTLEIHFTDAYVKRVLGGDLKDTSDVFAQALRQQKPFVMWKNGWPITTEIQTFIDDITNCHYHGNIKKVYLEAKVMELFVVLQAKLNEQDDPPETGLDKKEFEKIIEVGHYIEQNLHKTLTIADLASAFGINTTKLKNHFKAVFHTTIFKYITDVRMKHAISLIRAGNASISEVSYEVGYKNPQHFTVAFKKKYGYLPSNLLKGKQQY